MWEHRYWWERRAASQDRCGSAEKRRDLAIETTIATLFDAPTKAKNAAATLPQRHREASRRSTIAAMFSLSLDQTNDPAATLHPGRCAAPCNTPIRSRALCRVWPHATIAAVARPGRGPGIHRQPGSAAAIFRPPSPVLGRSLQPLSVVSHVANRVLSTPVAMPKWSAATRPASPPNQTLTGLALSVLILYFLMARATSCGCILPSLARAAIAAWAM